MNTFRQNATHEKHAPVRLLKPMAITLTTDPRKVTLRDLHNVYTFTLSKIGPYLDRVCKKWKLYPELNGSGGLHWHGIVWIKNKVAWYHFLHWYNKALGFVLLKDMFAINDGEQWGVSNKRDWTWYIQKDWEDMIQVLGLDLRVKHEDDHINRNSWKRFCGSIYMPIDYLIENGDYESRLADMA